MTNWTRMGVDRVRHPSDETKLFPFFPKLKSRNILYQPVTAVQQPPAFQGFSDTLPPPPEN